MKMGIVRYLGYPTFTNARYTFRGAVQDSDSWIRKVHRELKEFGTFTKKELFERYVPHVVVDGKVRSGWGTSVWGALQEVGIIQKSKFRRDRYPVMIHGPNFKELDNVIRFFETHGPMEWETIDILREYDSTEVFESVEQWRDFQDFFKRSVTHTKYVELDEWEPKSEEVLVSTYEMRW